MFVHDSGQFMVVLFKLSDDQSIWGALKSPPSQMLPLVLCVKRSRDRFRLSRAVMSELGGL